MYTILKRRRTSKYLEVHDTYQKRDDALFVAHNLRGSKYPQVLTINHTESIKELKAKGTKYYYTLGGFRIYT